MVAAAVSPFPLMIWSRATGLRSRRTHRQTDALKTVLRHRYPSSSAPWLLLLRGFLDLWPGSAGSGKDNAVIQDQDFRSYNPLEMWVLIKQPSIHSETLTWVWCIAVFLKINYLCSFSVAKRESHFADTLPPTLAAEFSALHLPLNAVVPSTPALPPFCPIEGLASWLCCW